MKVLGHVQRFGVGIQTAQGEMRNNGNPPITFRVDKSFVACVAYPAQGFSNLQPRSREHVGTKLELSRHKVEILRKCLQ